MNHCIKCGRQIPEGELFCLECSLNPGSSLFQETRPTPTGRMQTPAPRKAVHAAPVAAKERKQKKHTGLKLAFAIVTILLVLVVGFVAWQYTDMQDEWARLEAKEADLLLREKEREELSLELEQATRQLEELQQTIAEQEAEIKGLQDQSASPQIAPDPLTDWSELARLEEENKQLLLLEEELEGQIKNLTATLEASETHREKAAFLDTYVVFVENDGSRIYHTYDCARFSKKNFWAYSRKLAENKGFAPCAVCGGKVE